MNQNHLLLILTISIITNIIAMEPEKPFATPSTLQTLCSNQIVRGYGSTDLERKRKSAMLIKALQTGHHKSASSPSEFLINDLQQKYIGRYGWNNKKSSFIFQSLSSDWKINILCTHPNDPNLYIVDNQFDLRIGNIKNGKTVELLEGHQDTIRCVTTTDYNNLIATGSCDKTVKIWDINTYQLKYTLSGHNAAIERLASSGDMLASIDNTHRAIVFCDLSEGKKPSVIPIPTLPTSLVIDKNILYVGSSNGDIMFLDTRNQYSTIAQWSSWPVGNINCLAITPDNISLYAGSDNFNFYGQIKQWDIRNTKTHTRLINMHDFVTTLIEYSAVRNLHISKDGTKLSATNEKHFFICDLSYDPPKLLLKSNDEDYQMVSNTLFMNKDETEMHILMHKNQKSLHAIFSPGCTFDELSEQFASEEITNQNNTDNTCHATPESSPQNINNEK